MKELTVEAKLEYMDEIMDFVEEQLLEYDCPLKTKMQINIALDELFTNIVSYAYGDEEGFATIRVEIVESPLAVVITFIDSGIPYDPLKKEDPDTTLSAEERQIGGLGIYMVKKSMDEISYEYKDKQNILQIKKNL